MAARKGKRQIPDDLTGKQEVVNSLNKNRRKAIFNWAAKGLFFLRGGGGYTDTLRLL